MRNLKKVLALVIAFSMMLSVVAFAGYNDVDAKADYAGAVELLSALDIIKGDDKGNFNPDNTITRAEMAAIVCRAKGLENAANGAKGATAFVDVAADHWAAGYVNIASQNGIINGYGDGRFGPEDTVSFEQAVKMIVCALGFEPMAAQKGGWPTGYLVVANTYKITEGVANSTRADVATLVYNALSTPMMDQTTYGADAEFEILDGKKDRDYRTLLTDMDIYVATGIVYDVDVDEVAFYVTEDSDDLEFEYEAYDDDETPLDVAITLNANDTNIADYQFQSVDVYVQKDARKDYKVIAVVPSVIGETFALLSDDVKTNITGNTGKLEYFVDPANSSKTKELKLAVNTVVYNKQLQDAEGYDVEEICDMDDVELVFIENTGDTTYDVLVATKYTSAVVSYVEAGKDRLDIDDETVKFDFEDEEVTIILVDDAGNELTLEDFAENDVVAVVADADDFEDYEKYIKIVKLSNAAVTGVVESTFTSNKEDYIVIDGEEYKLDSNEYDLEDFKPGTEGIFYIGMTGKVIYFDGSSASEDYVYVIEAAKSESAFSADKWQVKVLTKNDGVVTYDTTEAGSAAFEEYAVEADWLTGVYDEEDDDLLIGVEETEWLWGAGDKEDVARLAVLDVNAKGEIKDIEAATGSKKTITVDKKYNDKTQVLAGKTLEDDIVIFNVMSSDADSVYATDLSYLVDDSGYAGYLFSNDGETAAMVVTDGESVFAEDAGFAIVTKIATVKDADDEIVTKISYVMNEEEGSVIFNDEDSENEVDGDTVDYEDLTVGSVFMFNATADDVATSYVVLAVMDEDDGLVLNADGVAKITTGNIEEGVYFATGYIANTKALKKGAIYVSGLEEAVSVASDSNKYTYNNGNLRNVVIETGDYMDHDDMTWASNSETEGKVDAVSFVFIKFYDGSVVDIYGMYDEATVDAVEE